MSTDIRPELSEKNKYWIEKHRYYELKHFCLQYPIWREAYKSLDGHSSKSASIATVIGGHNESNRTLDYAEARLYFRNRMEIIEQAAYETSPDFGQYICEAVTEGFSYEQLKARLRIPCCKETYYELYRRFFWVLSKARN